MGGAEGEVNYVGRLRVVLVLVVVVRIKRGVFVVAVLMAVVVVTNEKA
jgi:hypothetical protein